MVVWRGHGGLRGGGRQRSGLRLWLRREPARDDVSPPTFTVFSPWLGQGPVSFPWVRLERSCCLPRAMAGISQGHLEWDLALT